MKPILFFSTFIIVIICKYDESKHLRNQIESARENRLLLSSYCLDYDPVYLNLCTRCQDLLNLPNCNTCPIGYYSLYNQCMQCHKGSLDCTNPSSPIFCYGGYVQSGSSCICTPPKQVLYDWCTTSTSVYFYSYYRLGGIIVSKFSIEILTTNNVNDSTMYQFNTNNCNVLSNKAAFTTISTTMTCSVDPTNRNLFLISLASSQVTDNMYKILPQFSIANLFIKVGQLVQLANSITVQQTSTPNSIYYQANQISAPQCGFKNKQYRFMPGTITIPHSDLMIYGFSCGQVSFQIDSNDTTSTDTDEQSSLLAGIQMYPNDMTFDFNNVSFAEWSIQSTYVIQFICNLPFGLQSTNTVTIIKVSGFQVYYVSESYMMSTINTPNQIYIKQMLHSNYFVVNQADQFYYDLQIFDPSNNVVYTQPQTIAVYGNGGISPLLIKPPQPLIPQQYTMIGTLAFVQDPTLSFQTIYTTLVVEDPPSQSYATVLEGDQYNVDPNKPLTLTMEMFPSEDTNFSWSFYRTEKHQSVEVDAITDNPMTLPSMFFNQSETYIVELGLYFASFSDYKFYFGTIVSTISPNMQAVFNPDYLQYGLNFYDLLSFDEVYDGVSQYNRINLQHYFILSYWDATQYQKFFTSSLQNVPQIYFNWSQYVTDNSITSIALTFFVKDQSNVELAFSKTFFLIILPAPTSCWWFTIDTSGGTQGFISPITLTMDGCQSSYSDGILYYQFYYYLNQDEQSAENSQTTWPINLTRRYLTNFQLSNTITTILPPGTLIICVDVKDSHEGKVTVQQQNTIDEPSFTFDQYVAFLQQEEAAMVGFKNNQQFEEELGVISLIIECIIDFEANNPTNNSNAYLVGLKSELYSRLLSLPFDLLSNRTSGDMQEFVLRCIAKLLSTNNPPFSSQLVTIIQNLQDFLQKKHDEILYYGIYEQQTKDTYIRQMTVIINLICTYIPIIDTKQLPTNAVTWADLQTETLLLAQSIIALSLNVNQAAVNFSFDEVSLVTQRVDTQAMIQNYLLNISVPLSRTFDTRIIFDVMLQFWSQNIYANDPAFLGITQPFLATASSALATELKRVYAAVQPLYLSQYDVPIFYRRLQTKNNRVLIIEQQSYLILPSDTTLQYQFTKVQGSGVVICTQRIDEIWSASTCKTTVKKMNDGTFEVDCVCDSPSYTTLVYDVTTLFTDNQNIQADFSSKGISTILNASNWYQYAGVYVIFSINVVMVISLIFSSKLDKIQSLLFGNSAAAIAIAGAPAIMKFASNKIQPINIINTEADDPLISKTLNEKQKIKEGEDKTQNVNTFLQRANSVNLDKQMSGDQNSLDKFRLINQQSSSPFQNALDTPQLIIIQEPINKQAARVQQIDSIEKDKFVKENNVKQQTDLVDKDNILQSTNRIISLNTMVNTDRTLTTHNRRKRQSIQDRNLQSQTNVLNNSIVLPTINELNRKKIKKFKSSNTFDFENKSSENAKTSNTNTESSKQQPKEESTSKSLEKSQQYMNSLTVKRGIMVFHILLQIFIIHNKNQSRVFRFSSYYSNVVWTLAINATFGKNITISQVIILSLISVSTFVVYSILLGVLQKWKVGKYVSYGLYFLFIIFCYYVTIVAMFGAEPSNSNSMIVSFCYTLLINTFILQMLLALFNFWLSKKLILSGVKPTSAIFIATSADVIFEQFF